ncbi:MAG: winged helix DNA-binding domain-containing protein [Gemmatimonas sp.]
MTSTASNSARRIAIARLHHQHLTTTPTLTSAADVVRMLGAVQAQDYVGAKWAIGMRAHGLKDADVERAFNAGEILRTHVMRPTWHFVAPKDLRWMQRLTAARVHAKMAPYNRTLGLTPAVLRSSNTIIERALGGGTFLTRAQLKAALDGARIHTDGTQRLARLVMHAELEGLVCSGPRVGKQFTYALLAERAPVSRDLSGDDALAELTRRYFVSRAPATVQDFAWWSGLSIGECRRGVQMLGRELEVCTLGDDSYHVPRGFTLPRATSQLVHLLPNYDEFFIGFRDRAAIGDRIGSIALVTGGNALIANVVLVGGQLVGGWKRREGGGDLDVDITLHARLTSAERARVAAAVAQLRRFAKP